MALTGNDLPSIPFPLEEEKPHGQSVGGLGTLLAAWSCLSRGVREYRGGRGNNLSIFVLQNEGRMRRTMGVLLLAFLGGCSAFDEEPEAGDPFYQGGRIQPAPSPAQA